MLQGYSPLLLVSYLAVTYAPLEMAAATEVKLPPTVQQSAHGVTFSLQQLLPEQIQAFYAGRNFTAEQIKPYAAACIYMAVLRNDSAPGTIHFLRKDWQVKQGDKVYPIKTTAEWLAQLQPLQNDQAALLAFKLAQFPEEQEYEPNGDWNQGMLALDVPSGSTFAVRATWDIDGKPYELTLEEVSCVK